MKIMATDTDNVLYVKEVELIIRKDKLIVSLGGPYQWDLQMLRDEPAKSNILYIDAMGRNHKGKPVFCNYQQLMDIADKLEEELKELKIY